MLWLYATFPRSAIEMLTSTTEPPNIGMNVLVESFNCTATESLIEIGTAD